MHPQDNCFYFIFLLILSLQVVLNTLEPIARRVLNRWRAGYASPKKKIPNSVFRQRPRFSSQIFSVRSRENIAQRLDDLLDTVTTLLLTVVMGLSILEVNSNLLA